MLADQWSLQLFLLEDGEIILFDLGSNEVGARELFLLDAAAAQLANALEKIERSPQFLGGSSVLVRSEAALP
jgi:hypothetical protein